MKCSICGEEFVRLIEVTVTEDRSKYYGLSKNLVRTTTHPVCMECFFRLSGLASVFNVNKIPDSWFE